MNSSQLFLTSLDSLFHQIQIKGIVHIKMKVLSCCPENLFEFLSSVQHKRRCFEGCWEPNYIAFIVWIKKQRNISKYLLLCSTEKSEWHTFGSTWRWIL